MEQSTEACRIISIIRQWVDIGVASRSKRCFNDNVPVTSLARQQRSSNSLAFHSSTTTDQEDTVLYLGYGSNLSAETFRGKRNVKPISQVNVVVPALSLTFDLPGIPYVEPCFGNVRYRNERSDKHDNLEADDGYHKDRWQKGLVGVVYEVTRADYVNIIATEGGGSGYQDVLVDCYALSGKSREAVPEKPLYASFKAHTLYAPNGKGRPHSYAQPSPRYLKLITDGASEHQLPQEYQDFLHNIRTFHLTTIKQRIGQGVFLSFWAPFFLLIFGSSKIFLNPDGTFPKWFATLVQAMFTACWASYDHIFKAIFGDGERTIGDEVEGKLQEVNEKTKLLRRDVGDGVNVV